MYRDISDRNRVGMEILFFHFLRLAPDFPDLLPYPPSITYPPLNMKDYRENVSAVATLLDPAYGVKLASHYHIYGVLNAIPSDSIKTYQYRKIVRVLIKLFIATIEQSMSRAELTYRWSTNDDNSRWLLSLYNKELVRAE